jgi:hypothetical protein
VIAVMGPAEDSKRLILSSSNQTLGPDRLCLKSAESGPFSESRCNDKNANYRPFPPSNLMALSIAVPTDSARSDRRRGEVAVVKNQHIWNSSPRPKIRGFGRGSTSG